MSRGSRQRARTTTVGARLARASGLCFLLLAAGLWWVIRTPALPPIDGDRVGLDLGGERFVVELAADPMIQHRGLSGRESIDPLEGMLFAYPTPRALQFVMRDCVVPIDIAFLNRSGRVIGVHAMKVETPRQPWESKREYERRLLRYQSPPSAFFALEVAGGRLAELGIDEGSITYFDAEAVLARFE